MTRALAVPMRGRNCSRCGGKVRNCACLRLSDAKQVAKALRARADVVRGIDGEHMVVRAGDILVMCNALLEEE